MYYRIKNRFEVDLMKEELISSHVPDAVIDRMYEVTDILDSNYGSHRSSGSMGGYLLFFPTAQDYLTTSPIIFENYNIDSTLSEYDDVLASTQNMNWREQLYLLGSDDSLVFMYIQ